MDPRCGIRDSAIAAAKEPDWTVFAARGASVQPMSPMRRDFPYRVAIMETGMAGKAPFRRLSNRTEATFRFNARNETLIEYGPTFVRVSGTVRRACFPPLIPCENWLFNIFARYSTGFQNRVRTR